MKIELSKFCENYNISTESNIFKTIESLFEGTEDLSIFVAGGAIRNLIEGKEKVENDFDLFFKNEEELRIYENRIKTKLKYKGESIESDLNVSLNLDGQKIQLIKIYHNNAEDLIQSFDFTICMFAVGNDKILYCGDLSLFDLARKKLVVNKITYPIASLRRFLKYTNKGFHACGGAMKMFLNDIIASNPSGIENEIEYID